VKGPGEALRVVHDEAYEHDVQRRIPSTTKAREVLGFEAVTPLDTMLDEVIPWIRRAIAEDLI
jgi:UDP-glucose 4-epimerase